jgi:anti-anti-sigma regulatory factor
MVVIVLVIDAIAVYVDVRFLGYQLAQDLLSAALVIAFALSIGFVVQIGLRMMLRPVLRRIPLSPLPGWTRFPVWLQTVVMTTLIGMVLLIFGGVLTYSSVLRVVEEGIASERTRWLQSVVIPETLLLAPERRLAYVESLSNPEEEIMFLSREGRVVERRSMKYDLAEGTLRALSMATEPRLHKQDLSYLRVLAVPFTQDQLLCVVYESTVSASPVVQRLVQVLGVSALGATFFALMVGLMSGANLSHTVGDVTGRMDALAAKEIGLRGEAIAQTSLDEVGDLVQAFNRVWQRTDEYTTLLSDTVADLDEANEQRRRLLATMVGWTAPVIPVSEGLVIVPLAGYFDAERASHICPNLLSGIAQQRAQVVVIDLTGISEVTEALADHLARAARSVALMGCQIVLTGIGADLAWALTQMDSGLDRLAVHRDLEDGLAYAHAWLSAV